MENDFSIFSIFSIFSTFSAFSAFLEKLEKMEKLLGCNPQPFCCHHGGGNGRHVPVSWQGHNDATKACSSKNRTSSISFHFWIIATNLFSIVVNDFGQHSINEWCTSFHLLWALMFLKLYCSEAVLSSLAGGVHEQTFRKWSWYFVHEIANLQYKVILWENRFRGDIGNVCLVSVDGTDFEIYQLSPFWTGWYSHKFKGP